MSFRSDFREILTDSEELTALVSARIFPAIVPQGQINSGVCVDFHIAENDPTNNKSGASELDVIMVDVDVVGKQLLSVEEVDEEIRQVLEAHTDTTGITRCVYMESDELYDDSNQIHRITSGYKVTYKR